MMYTLFTVVDSSNKTTSDSLLSDSISHACERFSHKQLRDCHIAPTHWGVSKLNSIFPFPQNYEWTSLMDLARTMHATNSILGITPTIWQLEPLVYDSARKANVPVISVPTKNPMLIVLHLRESPIDILITTPEFFETIVTVVERAKMEPPKIVLIVHSSTSTMSIQPPNNNWKLIHELHLVPGYWLASQKTDSSFFILNESLGWTLQTDNTAVEITMRDNTLEKFLLPYAFSNTEKNSLYTLKI